MPVPTKIAVGVAKPKAQGQAITRTEIVNFKARIKPTPYPKAAELMGNKLVPQKYQKLKVNSAKPITP